MVEDDDVFGPSCSNCTVFLNWSGHFVYTSDFRSEIDTNRFHRNLETAKLHRQQYTHHWMFDKIFIFLETFTLKGEAGRWPCIA